MEEPLPALDTPGTFVVSARDGGGYRLFRTRTVIFIDERRTYLFFDEHLAGAESPESARNKARDPALPLVFVGPSLLERFLQTPWQVVWYRSLTEEERTSHGGL